MDPRLRGDDGGLVFNGIRYFSSKIVAAGALWIMVLSIFHLIFDMSQAALD
ncbi:MAG: hypothetical protein JSS01_05730 [Proteobacteria bacterium]|nr:hypothetical protein [Pseudomonadota bacterium]